MAEIVNLRLARKQKARTERERSAAQNRLVHGRTKAERDSEARRADRADAMLDGHRLERQGDSPPSDERTERG